MNEQWLVRIQGREYGPADFDTLVDWKREGRLLPLNEVRALSDSAWTTAGDIAGLFAPPPLPLSDRHPLEQRRDFSTLLADSLRIYRRAFLPFFCAAAAIALPGLVLELLSPAYGLFPKSGGLSSANLLALLAFVVLLVLWPVFLAFVQLATVTSLEAGEVSAGRLLRRSVELFPRFALLSVMVYGSYLFWTALPVLAMLSLGGGSPGVAAILLSLVLLAAQVVMVSRLWVNFLFWQQSAAIAGYDGAAAIRESKMLARSKRRPLPGTRPLWRGALLASLWFIVTLAISAGAEFPFVLSHWQEVTTPEQMLALVQSLSRAEAPHPLLIGSAVLASLLHALVRPVFGIAFVLLYFDARTDFTEEELDNLEA